VGRRAKDYAIALSLWLPLAEQGLAKAQYNLGAMYYADHGVPQEYAEAMKWTTLLQFWRPMLLAIRA